MVRNIQYTSIKRVLDNLLDHPLLRDVDMDAAIRYVLRFIELHGYPQLFEDKLADVEIHKFRGELPCDLISIQQVRDKCTGICLRAMTKSFNPGLKEHPVHHQKHPEQFPNLVNGYHNPMIPPHYMDGMDRWHDHLHQFPDHEMSFKTQGRIIYTSFPEGAVEMAYKAIPIDEDGYPLLIDDENYLAALEAYIKVRVFTIKFDTGKITAPVLLNALTDYAWLSAQLMDTFTIPSVSEMEVITRMWNTLVLNRDEFSRQFKQLGRSEYPYLYNQMAGSGNHVHIGVFENNTQQTDDSQSDNQDCDCELDMHVENTVLVFDEKKNDSTVNNNTLSL